jgi:outer membrane protein TolC
LFKSGAFNYGIGPSISLPIFDAGARQANLAMSQADQQIALSQYESAIQAAFREVADVLATRSTLNDRLDAQQRLVAATQANYTLAQARYKAGLDNYLTVLDAQRNLFSTQQAAISLQQAALISQVNLYKVLGGGAIDPAVTDTAAATP